MSKLLFDSQPLVVDPVLAVKIGLNEAIILQQINYWLVLNKKAGKNYRDGEYWMYNSITSWMEQFPFWSKNTIHRALTNLKNNNLLITANYNKFKLDKTLWYRINYEEVEKLEESVTTKDIPVSPASFRDVRERLKNSSDT